MSVWMTISRRGLSPSGTWNDFKARTGTRQSDDLFEEFRVNLPIDADISSHRPVIGRFIVAYKKLVRLIIGPYLRNVFESGRKQDEERLRSLEDSLSARDRDIVKRTEAILAVFADKSETAAAREAARLGDLERLLRATMDDLKDARERLLRTTMDEVRDIRNEVKDIREEVKDIKDIKEEVKDIRERLLKDVHMDLHLQRNRLDQVLTEIQNAARDGVVSEGIASARERLFDADYYFFENRFRGSREEIKARQSVYAPVFKEVSGRFPGEDPVVIDLGCGRGELLEVLKDSGVRAVGVDSNEAMVYRCREAGLEAVQADAFEYLDSMEDESVAGIVACQVIEHMDAESLSELVRLCFRKLRKGGKAVFETINPESLFAMKWFYMDLTHKKPVHPASIAFLMETAGFLPPEIMYLSPVPVDTALKETDENAVKLNKVVFGFQDYACIAEKRG